VATPVTASRSVSPLEFQSQAGDGSRYQRTHLDPLDFLKEFEARGEDSTQEVRNKVDLLSKQGTGGQPICSAIIRQLTARQLTAPPARIPPNPADALA
jgi:hypothetical protein